MSIQSPRYHYCKHLDCAHRHFFGAAFIKIVRETPGSCGWLFWRCNRCKTINANRVSAADINALSLKPNHGPVENVYSPDFCRNLIELAFIQQHAQPITDEEHDELVAALTSSQLDDEAHDLYLQLSDVRLA